MRRPRPTGGFCDKWKNRKITL